MRSSLLERLHILSGRSPRALSLPLIALSMLGCGRLHYAEPDADVATLDASEDARASIDAPSLSDVPMDAFIVRDDTGARDAFSELDAPSSIDAFAPDAFVVVDAGRDAGPPDAGPPDATRDAGGSPPTSGCPLLWSLGFAQQVNFRAPATSNSTLFVYGQSATAFSLGGGAPVFESSTFLNATSGAFIANAPMGTNALAASVGLGDRFFASLINGFAELDPATGAFVRSGTYTPGSGNGGGDWLRSEGAPWLFATTAYASPQVLVGTGYSGPDTDALAAIIDPTTGTPSRARRFVYGGSQVVDDAWSLARGEHLLGVSSTAPGTLDGVSIPSGAVLLRLNASLNVIGARTYTTNLLDASAVVDVIVYATSTELIAEQADGTRLWSRPLGGMMPSHVQILDDGTVLMVATVNNRVTAFGQDWGVAGAVSAAGVFVDVAGNYLYGTEGVLGTGSIVLTGAAVSGDGMRVVAFGRSTSADVAPCGTMLISSTVANGTFILAL